MYLFIKRCLNTKERTYDIINKKHKNKKAPCLLIGAYLRPLVNKLEYKKNKKEKEKIK